MTLLKLLQGVRNKAISDCQKILRNYSDLETNMVSAKMSDMKLFRPDIETQQMIDAYHQAKKGKISCNSNKRNLTT